MKLFYTISIFIQHVGYVNHREWIVNRLRNSRGRSLGWPPGGALRQRPSEERLRRGSTEEWDPGEQLGMSTVSRKQ